jgi:hypothetical protein
MCLGVWKREQLEGEGVDRYNYSNWLQIPMENGANQSQIYAGHRAKHPNVLL